MVVIFFGTVDHYCELLWTTLWKCSLLNAVVVCTHLKNTNIIEHTLSIAFDNMIIYELMMELCQQGKINGLCNLFNISDCLVLEDFCFIVVR